MSSTVDSQSPWPPAKAISMRLNREALAYLEELTEKSTTKGQAQPKLSIRFGDNPVIMIEGRSFPFSMAKDTAHTQIYKRRSTTTLQPLAEITHKANMTPVLSSDYKSRVKARAEEAEREKKSRKIALIDNPINTSSSSMKNSRAIATTTKRTPTSQSSGVIHSPVIVSSTGSEVSRSTSSSSSLRERVIQLLALKPFKLSLLANMVKASEKDLLRMIKKMATNSGDTWTLRPDIYKEVKIWDWSRYDTKEKEEVANNARRAFDALKVPLTAPERLRLEKPAPPVRPPKPKPASSPLITTTSATDDGESTTQKAGEDAKVSKKKKKASSTAISRKTATKPAVSTEPSPSHLKATVLTPPSHSSSNKISSPSPLKTSATHERHGGKSPLANKHNNTVASASHDASERSPLKRRSDEENNSSSRYKIPKRSEIAKLPSSRSDSEESTASYTQLSEKIPKITSVQEYAELEKRFRNHYREYKQLGDDLNRQRKFVEAIEAAEADKSAGIASIEYKDVKTKFEQSNGASEDKWQSLISMSERYVSLHAELVAMKDEMWRAFREDKIVNEIDQNGVVA
ncbi:hypothetical protein INT43_005639 [Umbelopsis isabellina]|uniref:RNA polymerase II elongation factor ELL N-terminal domain-containing protein n=1 Tax=Mortierella isabellina TaxID=91625 RepID=A0A8H7UB53_MORIS|nr:hypothetical protein INT43_005639 [Umbelopsis isabellina]